MDDEVALYEGRWRGLLGVGHSAGSGFKLLAKRQGGPRQDPRLAPRRDSEGKGGQRCIMWASQCLAGEKNAQAVLPTADAPP